MAVRFDQGRKRWLVEFEQNGVRVFRRLPKGCARSQAESLEGQLRREIFDHEVLDRKPELTIGEAIDLWLGDNRRKNQRKAQSEARQWEPWRGKLLRDAPDVAAEAVRQWAKLRSVRGVAASDGSSATTPRIAKPSTINRRLMMLKAVCKRMWKLKRIGENISGRIDTLREPPGKTIFLTRQEVRALATQMDSETTSATIWLLAYTGLRISEFIALTRSDLRSGTLYVAMSKTGKPRSVPVPPVARTYLKAIPSAMTYWAIRKEFNAARRKAGLQAGVTLHTLRHTYASWFLQQGGDLYTLSKLMGHSTIYTTARYGHLATDHLKKAVEGLK